MIGGIDRQRCVVIVLFVRASGIAVYLSFGPMAQCVVHALKDLARRARVTPASSPASHCKQCFESALSQRSGSRRLRSTLAAAPVLLAHANVTESINILS